MFRKLANIFFDAFCHRKVRTELARFCEIRDRDAEWRFWGLGIFASTVSIGTAACYYARCESDGNDKIDLTKLFTQVFVKKAYLQEVQKNENDRDPPDRFDLPTFSFDEVKRHGKNSDRIWVVFKQGVYDITDFVKLHPGGDKILLAAGGSVEPFWKIYAQHKTPEVLEILEDYRIGNLNEKDIEKIDEHSDDPFSSDPIRHPALIVNSQKPFNAETPASLLIDNFRTHNDLFFVRNHMPVPHINEKEHRVVVEGLGIKQPISLTIDELKTKYEPISIDSVVQCAGNRRNDMHNFKKVQGLMWTGTAISNAKWTGCRLREVLMSAGIDPDDKRLRHVQFVGEDADATGTHYGASIPFHKAMRPEVILAYSMNDDALPLDHGYPVRLIAPGIVGARQVKWLSKIIVSDKESASHWQQRDYKALPPSIQIGDNMPFEKYPAIQEYPVQSAICTATANIHESLISVGGYAWSGGGRGIIRVELSADGGKTWHAANLTQSDDQELDEMWAWTLWNCDLPIPENVRNKVELVCKATDRAYNTQPETASGIWNVRGLLHNAWHRFELKIEP